MKRYNKAIGGQSHWGSSFSNHDLSGWDVSNVTDHYDFSFNWGEGNKEPIWKETA